MITGLVHKGKILVRFAIDKFGKLIFCKVKKSTVNAREPEREIAGKIKRWAFSAIDKPGDVTEVVDLFVFSS